MDNIPEAPTPDAAGPSPEPPVAPAEAPAEDSPEALAKKMAKSRAENLEIPPEVEPEPSEKKSHKTLWLVLIFIFVALIGAAVAVFFLVFDGSLDKVLGRNAPAEPAENSSLESEVTEDTPAEPAEPLPKIYSRLSGEELASEAEDAAPTYCVQIPNGVDGARDQVGLSEAKVVFEAIAESGITRFAAIFQNPPAVVGPIRSLRIYYLNWDVPFDCTVVHAGGAPDAISALRSYGTRELDENGTFMWRSEAYYPSGQSDYRRWNNLFTSGSLLSQYNSSRSYLSSDIHGFPHLTPDAAALDRTKRQIVHQLKIDEPATGDTDALAAKVTHIDLRFGNIPNFNPVFDYNSETNSYNRSYETGYAHNVFSCASENDCQHLQLSPKVVIAMIVQEKRAAYDNYHEDISSIGAGDAYVFQNGDAILGTWEKSSASAQIIFRDSNGAEIALVPGQTWISAIPNYGSVHYE